MHTHPGASTPQQHLAPTSAVATASAVAIAVALLPPGAGAGGPSVAAGSASASASGSPTHSLNSMVSSAKLRVRGGFGYWWRQCIELDAGSSRHGEGGQAAGRWCAAAAQTQEAGCGLCLGEEHDAIPCPAGCKQPLHNPRNSTTTYTLQSVTTISPSFASPLASTNATAGSPRDTASVMAVHVGWGASISLSGAALGC